MRRWQSGRLRSRDSRNRLHAQLDWARVQAQIDGARLQVEMERAGLQADVDRAGVQTQIERSRPQVDNKRTYLPRRPVRIARSSTSTLAGGERTIRGEVGCKHVRIIERPGYN
jgi:hypothetical protein